MGNQLCSQDGLETTSYRTKSRTSGIQMMQRTQWYQPQFKQEDTGTPILSLTVRSRLQSLGNFTYDHGITGQYFKTSKFVDSNTIYSGEWTSNKPHGKGKLYFPDGSFFEGTFKEGKTYGRGRFIEFNGNYFEGTLMNNQPEGEGVHNDFDGVYQGQFKQGKANGIGSYRGKGISFKGTFVDGDKREGELVWGENGQYTYRGHLLNNLFHGKGILVSTSGKYQGNFQNGQKAGYGTYFWNDGRKYTGMYQNDKKNGYGELYDLKGHPAYKGVWRDDEIAGDGVSFKKNMLTNSLSNETVSMF